MKFVKLVLIIIAVSLLSNISCALLRESDDPTVKTCKKERMISCGIVMEDNDWKLFKDNFKKGCSYDPEKSQSCSTGFITVPKDLKNDIKSIKTDGNCICNFSFLYKGSETLSVQTNKAGVSTKGKKVEKIFVICSKSADNLPHVNK